MKLNRRRYEPRRIISPTTPRDRAMQRNNENLNALLQACERLVDHYDAQRVEPTLGEMFAIVDSDDIERIKEALAALGRIEEQ